MKISEQQLRKIIRSQILKEFKIARVKRFSWQTCRNVDLPSSIFKSEGAIEAVNRAEKAAAIAAQVYGVPGMVCDIFSSLIGDNKNRKYNRDTPRSGKTYKPGALDWAIYSEAIKDYMGRKATYVKEIIEKKDKDETEKSTAATTDMQEYNNMIGSLRAHAATIAKDTKPLDYLEEVNQILGIEEKYGKDQVKAIIKEAARAKNNDASPQISRNIAQEAQKFAKTIAANNLSNTDVAQSYSSISSYLAYCSLVGI